MTDDVDAWMARGADEAVRWSGRPRTTRVLPAVALGVALVVVGLLAAAGGFGVVTVPSEPAGGLLSGVLFVLVGVAIPVWAYVQLVNTRFVVTDRALYRKTGVFSRTVRRVALRRVQNSTFSQSVTGSLFGYGSIDVEAAGGGSIRFDDVEEPGEVRALIGREVEGGGADAREIPGTVEQWEAVLGEVRALRRAFETGAEEG